MMRLLAVLIGGLLTVNLAAAAGDAAAGKNKSQPCAACHGADGKSPTQPNYPILAGQHADYLLRTLKDYKSGERKNAIMAGMVAALSEQDMKDLAAFYANQAGLQSVEISAER